MAGKKTAADAKRGPLFIRYALDMHFTGRLCGSVPQSEELIRPWLESRAPANPPEDGPTLDDLAEEVTETLQPEEIQDEKIKRITLGFQFDPDEGGLFVRAGTIRAHLKDCANQVKEYLGHKAFRAHLANRVFIQPDRVFIYKGDAVCTTHDGEFDQPVHVMTRQGPRSALKRIRYIERPTLSCTVLLLNDGVVTEEELRAVLDYGSVHGYGGERSMGEGQYTYVLRREDELVEQLRQAS